MALCVKDRRGGEGGSLLLPADLRQPRLDVALVQRGEPEAGAARLQRRDDLADVVADEAKPRVARVLLYHCTDTRSTQPPQPRPRVATSELLW